MERTMQMNKNMAEHILTRTGEKPSFLDELTKEIGHPKHRGKAAVRDFRSEDTAKVTMQDVFRVLGRHLEGAKRYEFERALPYALQEIWEETVLV